MSDAAPELVLLVELFRAECNMSSDDSTHSILEASANIQVLSPNVEHGKYVYIMGSIGHRHLNQDCLQQSSQVGSSRTRFLISMRATMTGC